MLCKADAMLAVCSCVLAEAEVAPPVFLKLRCAELLLPATIPAIKKQMQGTHKNRTLSGAAASAATAGAALGANVTAVCSDLTAAAPASADTGAAAAAVRSAHPAVAQPGGSGTAVLPAAAEGSTAGGSSTVAAANGPPADGAVRYYTWYLHVFVWEAVQVPGAAVGGRELPAVPPVAAANTSSSVGSFESAEAAASQAASLQLLKSSAPGLLSSLQLALGSEVAMASVPVVLDGWMSGVGVADVGVMSFGVLLPKEMQEELPPFPAWLPGWDGAQVQVWRGRGKAMGQVGVTTIGGGGGQGL